MRVSLPVLSDDEVAAQVRAEKRGLADSTVKRAVKKALDERKAHAAAVQSDYGGKLTPDIFTKRTVPVLDAEGKPTGAVGTYTVPKE